MRRHAWLMTILLLNGCGSEQPGQAASPGPCASSSERFALPNPAWQGPNGLVPPSGDAAFGLLMVARESWTAGLSQVDGWPRRPTLVVPLDNAAESVDAEQLALYVVRDGVAEAADTRFAARLSHDGRTLIAIPLTPVPPRAREVVFVVSPTALRGARALPTCGADGAPHASYGEAAALLPPGAQAQLTLPFRVASTVHQLEALWTRLEQVPALTVASVQPRLLSEYGDAAPPSEVAVHLAGQAMQGLLELPDYRDAQGHFQPGADGAPAAQGTTLPGFLVVEPAVGQAPHPFVLFQHGGSQNKTDVLKLAGPLAQAGFALVAIDLPSHGDREEGTGGGDMAILDFEDPVHARDNLRQAAADHLAVLSGIAALNQALATHTGHVATLDASRAYYMGLSLGAVTGSMTFAAGRSVKGAALFVGGGGYPEMLVEGMFSIFMAHVISRDSPEPDVIFGLLETVLDGADPMAYAQEVEDRAQAPRPALFFQAIDDPIVSEQASDQWARAFGAQLARPLHHEVAEMAQVDLPARDGFRWAGSATGATRLLMQCPMQGVAIAERHPALIVQDYSQRIVAHCLKTLRDTGSCEVADDAFGEP